jgi:hypothetical protein
MFEFAYQRIANQALQPTLETNNGMHQPRLKPRAADAGHWASHK